MGDGLNSAGYQFNYGNNSSSDQITVKADWNFSDKLHFFERISWQQNTAIDSLNGAQNVVPGEAPGTQGGTRWGVAAGADWTVSSTVVNQFRYGHQSLFGGFQPPRARSGAAA